MLERNELSNHEMTGRKVKCVSLSEKKPVWKAVKSYEDRKGRHITVIYIWYNWVGNLKNL